MQMRISSNTELSQSRQTSKSTQLKEDSGSVLSDSRSASAAQRRAQDYANRSQASAQLKLIQAKMETKADIAQRVEEEEPLQGKFDTAQRVEEEEPLQGKFDTAQRVEEEEPLQGKFETAQRKEQAKPNNTGLPNQLKSGIESMSGMSMDHVKVHYNSDKPAQLNAHAYAQGSDIHVAPGQEKHLPHEAWHVVQQAQGRVKPTMQMKAGVPVNDDVSLETEADVMGEKAMSVGQPLIQAKQIASYGSSPFQLRKNKRVELSAAKHYNDGWGATYGIQDDETLKGKVDDGVKGSGEVLIGNYVARSWRFQGTDFRNLVKCNILYKDESEGVKQHRTTYTSIFHCGPTGPKWRQYYDGAAWVKG